MSGMVVLPITPGSASGWSNNNALAIDGNTGTYAYDAAPASTVTPVLALTTMAGYTAIPDAAMITGFKLDLYLSSDHDTDVTLTSVRLKNGANYSNELASGEVMSTASLSGVELVANSTFDVDTSGWVFEGTATNTSTTGFLAGTSGGATNLVAHTTIVTEIGKSYKCTILTGPASTAVYVGSNGGGGIDLGSTGFATNGTKTVTFTATTTLTYLAMMSVGAVSNASLNSITTQELVPQNHVLGSAINFSGMTPWVKADVNGLQIEITATNSNGSTVRNPRVHEANLVVYYYEGGRELSTGVETDLDASVVEPFFLVEMMFDSAPVYMWSGYGEITVDSKVYVGAGNLMMITETEETSDISVRGVSVSLNGLPSEVITLALGEPYQGRVASIYLGVMTDTSTVTEIFSGYIDTMNIQDTGETCSISVSIENKLIDLERPRIIRYTSAYQEVLYPGDLGLRFIEDMQDKPVYWGKVGDSPSGGSGSGGSSQK